MVLNKQNKILILVSIVVLALIVYALNLKFKKPLAVPASEEVSEFNSALTNWFDNQDNHYRIRYPNNWDRQEAGPGTMIFTGRIGSPSFYTTVNVQAILSKKIGGDYRSINDFFIDIKKQARLQSKQVKFVKEGSIDLTILGKKTAGKYLLFTYEYKGIPFKQWQVVVYRNDQQVFYAWAYTAPLSQYELDYPIAKGMLDSWAIY